jgi:hypothetical protein
VSIYKTITVKNQVFRIGFCEVEFDFESYVLDATGKRFPVKVAIGLSISNDIRTKDGSDYRDGVVEYIESVLIRVIADV